MVYSKKHIKRMKHIITFCFVILLASCGVAQYGYSTKSKKAIKLFEMARRVPGQELDEYGRPNYLGAMEILDQAIKKDEDFWEAYIMKSEFAELLGQPELALQGYEKAIEIDPMHAPAGSTYYYACDNALKIGDYEKCKKYGEVYLKNRANNPAMAKKAREFVKNADFALNSIKNKKNLNPINLGPGVNTQYPEYFPTITVDQKTLLFTRRIPDQRVQVGEQEDFYESKLSPESNIWMTATAMPPNINTEVNEGAPTFAPDGRTIIFVGCPQMDGKTYGANRFGYGSCDLFVTKKTGDKWSTPVNLPGKANTNHWETQPSLSADGKTLYFIRGIIQYNRMGGAKKTGDIYVSYQNDKGEWSVAEKLPNNINTPENESSCLIHPDGKTLYFASDGHIGMGGFDIYMTQKQDNGTWSNPINVGYPINTFHNENSLLVSADGEIAFFGSDRPGGFGKSDLYYFDMPEHIRPVKTIYMDGVVFDDLTKNKLEANFKLIDLATGREMVKSSSDPVNGSFVVTLPINKDYALYAEKDGYNMYSKSFKLTIPENSDQAYHIKVPMTPIKKIGGYFVLENIFFDLSKATLRPESFIELNKLKDFLVKNATTKVEIGGHTDTRGDDGMNKTLSNDRAKSVYEFLIKEGISKDRLTYKGYGETKTRISDEEIVKLATEKEKEAAHQKNRRTEITILSF